MRLLIFRPRIGLIHMEQEAQMMFYLLSSIPLFSDDLYSSWESAWSRFHSACDVSLEVCLKCVLTAPPGGPPQYSTIFGSRLSSTSTPARWHKISFCSNMVEF